MIKIVVYLSEDYKKADSFLLENNISRNEILETVNNKFDTWYFYDIWNLDENGEIVINS